MLRVAITVSWLVALTACSTANDPRYGRFIQPVANPGQVVATEIAFARAAQKDGQWTAFKDFSTADALMFVPEAVNAHDWLRKQADPPEAVKWQPHEVWSSCDGSIAVTKGAWQRPNGTNGYFTTIWKRRGDGEYRWIIDQGDTLSEPLVAPEFVQTMVADCEGQTQYDTIYATAGAIAAGQQSSADNTLKFRWRVNEDRSRSLDVDLWSGGKMTTVLRSEVAAPQ